LCEVWKLKLVICAAQEAWLSSWSQHTVCRHLVALDAVLAGKTGNAGLLVDLGGDRVL
jgi:hypothetical protein